MPTGKVYETIVVLNKISGDPVGTFFFVLEGKLHILYVLFLI